MPPRWWISQAKRVAKIKKALERATFHSDHFDGSYGESLDPQTHFGTCGHWSEIVSPRTTATSRCGKCGQWDSYSEAGNVCNFWTPPTPS